MKPVGIIENAGLSPEGAAHLSPGREPWVNVGSIFDPAPEGRHNNGWHRWCRPSGASISWEREYPGLAPWAKLYRPFGAETRQPPRLVIQHIVSRIHVDRRASGSDPVLVGNVDSSPHSPSRDQRDVRRDATIPTEMQNNAVTTAQVAGREGTPRENRGHCEWDQSCPWRPSRTAPAVLRRSDGRGCRAAPVFLRRVKSWPPLYSIRHGPC
jgi:hypothetical protein